MLALRRRVREITHGRYDQRVGPGTWVCSRAAACCPAGFGGFILRSSEAGSERRPEPQTQIYRSPDRSPTRECLVRRGRGWHLALSLTRLTHGSAVAFAPPVAVYIGTNVCSCSSCCEYESFQDRCITCGTDYTLQASQHAVAADVDCGPDPQKLSWSTASRRERACAGSRNMKVDRIGALHNSYLCTRCLRVRHLANRFNSRRRQTSLRAPLDCRGGSVWVGSALKKYRILDISLETRSHMKPSFWVFLPPEPLSVSSTFEGAAAAQLLHGSALDGASVAASAAGAGCVAAIVA